MNNRIIINLFYFIILSLSILNYNNHESITNNHSLSETIINKTIKTSYESHEPIIINSDEELESIAISGSGIFSDPFILEDWVINTSTTGIYIARTTQYFVIRNCTLDIEGTGIFLFLIGSGTARIENNTCQNGDSGIEIISSDSNIVSNNYCINNTDGIYLEQSSNTFILNNTCSFNRKDGIYSLDSTTFILNNICNNNQNNSISVNGGDNSLIEFDLCQENGLGIYIYESTYSKIITNRCIENRQNGIRIQASISCNVTNNVCDKNTEEGIYVFGNNAIIVNNTCKMNKEGMFIDISNSCLLQNNTCNDNFSFGIKFTNSNYCNIIWNNFTANNEYGIYLTEGFINTIHNNDFINNGLDLYDSQAYNGQGINNWTGNYWSDYTGNGSYLIAGSEGCLDSNPLNQSAFYIIPTESSRNIPIFAEVVFILFLIIIIFIELGIIILILTIVKKNTR